MLFLFRHCISVDERADIGFGQPGTHGQLCHPGGKAPDKGFIDGLLNEDAVRGQAILPGCRKLSGDCVFNRAPRDSDKGFPCSSVIRSARSSRWARMASCQDIRNLPRFRGINRDQEPNARWAA